MKYKHLPGTVIPSKKPHGAEKWCDGWLVQVAVSQRYNGGIIVDGEWCDGFKVDPPIVPKGFSLHSIHCGANLMEKPPLLSMYLKRN